MEGLPGADEGQPELLGTVEMESMSEHFGLKTAGHVFDCTGYAAVRNLPAVDKIQVLQDLTNHYVADITCDAEYAVRRNWAGPVAVMSGMAPA